MTTHETIIPRPIESVLVIGAGLMGSGIAQVVATALHSVTLSDVSPNALDIARDRIADSLRRLVASKRLPEDAPQEVLSRIKFTTDASEPAEAADLVIEAVIEDLEVKQDLFETLDAICPPNVILATNTSQYPIGRVGLRCKTKQRIVGMHWSNPPPLMPLVEIIAADTTADSVLAATLNFVHACGHQTVICRKDVPGFISTRLYQALVLEAMRIVEDGLATAEDVDSVARLMHGHKMGPLAALDFAGLDTALKVSKELSSFYGSRFNASPMLQSLVDAGHTGRKSGEGFYKYPVGSQRVSPGRLPPK